MKEINFAATLAAKRREKGITQGKLAEHIGVTIASVSKWETGQSYPDITFLPVIAAYFDISIDDLMSYTPQLSKRDAEHIYKQLDKKFHAASFEVALAECRDTIKKYYSCHTLLYQMALLLLNHHTQARNDEEMEAVLSEAIALCERIRVESGDVWSIKEARLLQAHCYISLNMPQDVLELIGDKLNPDIMEEKLTVKAHVLKNNIERAKEVAQVSMHQHLICLLDMSISYTELCVKDSLDEAEEAFERIQLVFDALNVDHDNPELMFRLYAAKTQLYISQEQTEKAIEMFELSADFYIKKVFTHLPSQDNYFDLINERMLNIDKAESYQNKLLIERDILIGLLHSAEMSELKDDKRYSSIVEKLNYCIEA